MNDILFHTCGVQPYAKLFETDHMKTPVWHTHFSTTPKWCVPVPQNPENTLDARVVFHWMTAASLTLCALLFNLRFAHHSPGA
jgi:hypothetical protein